MTTSVYRPPFPFLQDDGGRGRAGFTGHAGDCVVRAIAIASGVPYLVVYQALNGLARLERKPARGRRSSSREGVHRRTYDKLLLGPLGATWTPTMAVGRGCTVHLCREELPSVGRFVVALSRHLTALVDGVVRDNHDPARDGMRCVYGYYSVPAASGLTVRAIVELRT